MSRTIHGNPYLSRPVGTNKPPRFRRERVKVGVVSISQDPRHEDPAWHWLIVAKRFVRTADLYDNRKKG